MLHKKTAAWRRRFNALLTPPGQNPRAQKFGYPTGPAKRRLQRFLGPTPSGFFGFLLRLPLVAIHADRLQVAVVVSSAFRLRHDVVDLPSRPVLSLGQAWLTKPFVSRQNQLPDSFPICSVTSCLTASSQRIGKSSDMLIVHMLRTVSGCSTNQTTTTRMPAGPFRCYRHIDTVNAKAPSNCSGPLGALMTCIETKPTTDRCLEQTS